MPVSTFVRIGTDNVDINQPCDIVTALKKMQLRLASGGLRETVRFDGEEVTYQRANDKRLEKLIQHYETECAKSKVGGARARRRYAKRIKFT